MFGVQFLYQAACRVEWKMPVKHRRKKNNENEIKNTQDSVSFPGEEQTMELSFLISAGERFQLSEI